MRIRSGLAIATLVIWFSTAPTQGQQFFEDVTPDWFAIAPGPQRSVSAADIDNDGWPDLFTSVNWEGPVYLWRNDAGQRWRVEADVPDKPWLFNGGGAVFGDYDNDGDVDLFVPLGMFCKEAAHRNMLWRNDRGVFYDVALEAGLDDELATDNAVWLDANGDGHLDLYTGNLGNACLGGEGDLGVNNRLYLANGDGTFHDATSTSGLDYQIGTGESDPGGSNGGMVARDFTGNGWPDLLVTAFLDPNRLFLNDQGSFSEHVSAEINDPGQAFGIAVADFDGDADLDLFTGSGGSAGGTAYRSQYLINLGNGRFVDALESVGLRKMADVNVLGVGAGDVDNDGDVDLFVAEPHTLYRNDGAGTFTDVTDQSGVTRPVKTSLSFADYNLDGRLDVVAGSVVDGTFGGIFLNSTAGSGHWLGVELVGVTSNRSAIGAQLLAIFGQRRLLHEISGGSGFNQDDLVAHFGLGDQTQLDSLVIRWPSGRTETLTAIAADQRVRIIEGRGVAYPKRPSVFVEQVSAVKAGESVEIAARVRPALFEPEATVTGVTADLTSLGGPAATPLVALGDGSYQLEASFSGNPDVGVGEVVVLIDQQTSLGPYWIRLESEVVLDRVSTSVDGEQTSSPLSFALSQNYPNPFNSATTIHFSLPVSARVDLGLFNLTGQLVATLASGVHDAGSHHLRWDGSDDSGVDLASGVYLCRLVAGAHRQTQRMLLLR
jgi:hypothetical protein